jgi:hypothetical protein
MNKLAITIVGLALFTGAGSAQPQGIMNPGQAPGDALYGLDRATESIELAFARTVGGEERAAKVRANHAEERLAEAQKLADQNRTERVGDLMNQYNRNMEEVMNASQRMNDTEFNERVQNMTQKHVEVLQRVQEKVPEEAQQGIQTALENSQRNMAGPGQRGPPADAGPGNETDSRPEDRAGPPGNQSEGAPENGSETGDQPEDQTENQTDPDSGNETDSGDQNTTAGPQA